MATDPTFAATPNDGTPAILGVLETSLTVPTTTSTIFSAGANGSLLLEVDAEAVAASLTPTTVAGLIYMFLHDGSTYHLFDTIPVTAVTASATVAPWRATPKQYYPGIILKTGWTLRCSQSIAGNNSLLKVTAFGLDA